MRVIEIADQIKTLLEKQAKSCPDGIEVLDLIGNQIGALALIISLYYPSLIASLHINKDFEEGLNLLIEDIRRHSISNFELLEKQKKSFH